MKHARVESHTHARDWIEIAETESLAFVSNYPRLFGFPIIIRDDVPFQAVRGYYVGIISHLISEVNG